MKKFLDKIIHDDCMNVLPLFPDKSVGMTLTDIPYDKCNKKSGGLRQLDKGLADRLNFDLSIFLEEVERITYGSIYIFCGIEQISSIFTYFTECGLITRHCIWQKTNPSPMNGEYTWLSATENCVFAKFHNATFNQFCKPNVWRYKSGDSKIHPTQKPVELFIDLIKASSKENEVVFDPCIGSGTTAIACINTNRKFIGVELDKEHYQVAKNRIATELKSDIFSTSRTPP